MSRKRKLPDNVVQFNSRIHLVPAQVTQKDLFEEECSFEEAQITMEIWLKKRCEIQQRLDAGARIEPGERIGMVSTDLLKALDGIPGAPR